jgi:8-oxo-dGTP pyrophosphatase MutT (NUDIX family)
MPNMWVFPGGAVDPGDALAPAASEPSAETQALLAINTPRRKPRAFALAAVREMFEEAGLIIGRRGAPTGARAKGWAAYAAHDAAPELHKLAFIARAITPPMGPRRFDARFFLADAEQTLMDDRPIGGDEELLHMRWFALDEAAKLDVPMITSKVLEETEARMRGENPRPLFFRFKDGAASYSRL